MILHGHLIDEIKLTKISDHAAAGTSAVTSAAVDMAGYDGAVFITSLSVANDGNHMKLQASSDDGSTDSYGDLEGTSVVSGTSASSEDLVIDIQRPEKRYLKAIVTRGSSTTCESIWVIQYNGRSLPVTNALAGTIAVEKHITPAEGTA